MPEGIKEKIGDALGAPDRRVKGDLGRFKDLVEGRGRESGLGVARSRVWTSTDGWRAPRAARFS